MRVIKAPHYFSKVGGEVSVFLAGSIEMGSAVDWQTSLAESLSSEPVIFLNPRRDHFDWETEQSVENPLFYQQVSWELDHIHRADIVVVNFLGTTKSPISLLELGMVSVLKPKSTLVCCAPDFWRRGNVEVVCGKAEIPLFSSIGALRMSLITRVNRLIGA